MLALSEENTYSGIRYIKSVLIDVIAYPWADVV